LPKIAKLVTAKETTKIKIKNNRQIDFLKPSNPINCVREKLKKN
jgi:hypothetical protein